MKETYLLTYGLNFSTEQDDFKRYHFVEMENIIDAESIAYNRANAFYETYEGLPNQFNEILLPTIKILERELNTDYQTAKITYERQKKSVIFYKVEVYEPKKHRNKCIIWKRENYLFRYFTRKKDFFNLIEVHARTNKYKVTQEIKEKIYNYLRDMVDPVNFHFVYALAHFAESLETREEIFKGLKNEIANFLIDMCKMDLEIYGFITAGTVECFEVQKVDFPFKLTKYLKNE